MTAEQKTGSESVGDKLNSKTGTMSAVRQRQSQRPNGSAN